MGCFDKKMLKSYVKVLSLTCATAGLKQPKYDIRKDDPLLKSNKKKKNRLGQHARRKLAEARNEID